MAEAPVQTEDQDVTDFALSMGETNKNLHTSIKEASKEWLTKRKKEFLLILYMFFVHVTFLIVILFALYNLTFGNGKHNEVWVAILSSVISLLVPSPMDHTAGKKKEAEEDEEEENKTKGNFKKEPASYPFPQVVRIPLDIKGQEGDSSQHFILIPPGGTAT